MAGDEVEAEAVASAGDGLCPTGTPGGRTRNHNFMLFKILCSKMIVYDVYRKIVVRK